MHPVCLLLPQVPGEHEKLLLWVQCKASSRSALWLGAVSAAQWLWSVLARKAAAAACTGGGRRAG